MKNITALILILALLAAAPALAEGKLEITQENLQIYKPYAFVFAKLSNVGDAPIEITSILDLLDEDGELLRTGECSVMGSVLLPGESTYAYFGIYMYGDMPVSRYACEWACEEAADASVTVHFDSTAELVLDEEESYFLVTFTNTTDEVVFYPCAAGVLLDAEGRILYMSVPYRNDLGVAAGSTVIFKYEIPPYVLNNISLDGLTADSIVYTDSEEY